VITTAIHCYSTAIYTFLEENTFPLLGWAETNAEILRYGRQRLHTPRNYVDSLPIPACLATDGKLKQALPVAAAWALFILARKTLDNVVDEPDKNGYWAEFNEPHDISKALYAISSANIPLGYLAIHETSQGIVNAFNHVLASSVASTNKNFTPCTNLA
jgi:hypothetical protein